MSELENARAQAEAMKEPTTRALRSARRAQLWAGLNRYLASEAVHAHKAAEQERERTPAEDIDQHTAEDTHKDTDQGPALQGRE